MPEDCEA